MTPKNIGRELRKPFKVNLRKWTQVLERVGLSKKHIYADVLTVKRNVG